jgi:hypothetical protein
MNIRYSNEWLRRKISADPDAEPAAGSAPEAIASENTAAVGERIAPQLRHGLAFFVRQLRCRADLTIPQLALVADVSEDDLRRIEHDPHFTAGARLIYQLSEYFSVPLTELSQMAGLTQEIDRAFFNEVMRYAAYSDGVSTLTEQQRAALDSFVALVHQRAKG